jgi:hypothetical protein
VGCCILPGYWGEKRKKGCSLGSFFQLFFFSSLVWEVDGGAAHEVTGWSVGWYVDRNGLD